MGQVHGRVVGHGDGRGRLQRGPVARVFGLAELSLRLDFQGGSEVEAGGRQAEDELGFFFLC